MTNEMPSSSTESKSIPLGARLKTAREALGLERRDAAAQLRLNEKVILMMEKDRYPADLPVTFIRGYIRAYGKLLQIPEYEIKKAIEPIKPKPVVTESPNLVAESAKPLTSGNYIMQLLTYLIILTLAGLVGLWWYNHAQTAVRSQSETTISMMPNSLPSTDKASTPSQPSISPSEMHSTESTSPAIDHSPAENKIHNNSPASTHPAPTVREQAANDDEEADNNESETN